MSDIDIHLLREKIVREVEQWKEKTANNYTIEAEARWSEANYILGILDSLRQEQPEVDLEKVVMIDNVIMNMTAEGYNNGYKTRPFYEEVLRRFNARKEE